jgi:pimeloyl-ACP methyl ester carboxylesterase
MRTYVLVHGAWGGSHSWKDFAPLLWAAGHRVFTPSLTGLGERTHLAGPDVNLTTHITDVVNCIEYNDLRDIVLVGHSYGGMVVTGVQEILHDRIAHIVYEDAFLPRDGESCWTPEMVRANLGDDGWSVMRPGQPLTAATQDEPAQPVTGMSPQPRGTLEEPVRLSMPLEQRHFTRTYVKAADNPRPREDDRRGFFWEAAARVSGDPHWRYFELPCGHGIHREMPQEFAGILLALA